MNKENVREILEIALRAGELVLVQKTYAQFRSRLWESIVSLFVTGRDANFLANFVRAIDQQLTEAWNRGAASVGVEPDEMTADDFAILEPIINNEMDFVERLAGDIQADKDAGMTLEKFVSKYGARVDLWANRYNEVVNRARMQFGSKERLCWRIGRTEEHCDTCAQLNGIVAFGHEWESAGLHPQMPPNNLLECGGWQCECSLVPTKQRRTARALDKLTAIAMGKHL